MFTLRRRAWMRWLPPIDRESPSPVIDPDVEVGPGHGQPGGDGRGPAVDRVDAVGVHVVGEAGRAADAGDEHGVLAPDPELGHEHLHGGQDRVVAAARAPADLLVRGPVLAGGGDGDLAVSVISWPRPLRRSVVAGLSTPSISRTALSISAARNGTPWTLESDWRRPGTRPAPAWPAGRGWPRARAPCRRRRAPRPGRPGTG